VSDRFITKAHRQENCKLSKGSLLSQNSHTVPAAARPEYLFVDAVRFWSMLAVVALHSTQWIGAEPSEGSLPFAVACLFKYGTIGFFLISGFLLGDRMKTSAALPYLSRRLRALLVPWAFWFGLYILYLIASDLGHHRLAALTVLSLFQALRTDAGLAAFSTSFWFVPNLALGMCILMAFRRYLYSVRFGAVLFLVNFLYVADIYGEWFPPQHTVALFAFVSYLWLGSYAARNLSRVSAFMENMPMVLIAALVGLSYVASIAEFKILMARHSIDPSNTLRLSNQVFSILVVLLLFKLKSASWPGFIHVREQTFSIYLLHNFFLRMGSLPLNHWFIPRLAATLHPSISFLSRAALFLFAYGGSLLVGRWIASSDRWRWTIGLKSRQVLTTYEKTSTASKIKALILADTWPAK
jgi:hypothetical protein